MNFQPKPTYLPEDVKSYTAPTWWRVNRDRVWVTVVLILWAIASVQPTEAETWPVKPFTANQLARLVSACMSGGGFNWQDPHTGAVMSAQCDVQTLYNNELRR